MDRITPVILCGGSGTRLWPRSRPDAPKPFLRLVGDRTLFQETLARCSDNAWFSGPLVVAGRAHLGLVKSQLSADRECRVIVEPQGRNTAAAIALAALRLPEDAVMLICPSDHHIADNDMFCEAALKAGALAAEGWLVALGIEPEGPETGYGYIKRGPWIEGAPAAGFRVERFVEKPDRARAEAFLAEGGYSWNGGIFAFRAGTFLEELARHRPELAAKVREAVEGGEEQGQEFHPDEDAFAQIVSESVDYALMEHTDRAAMVPASMGWSDIGTWSAVRAARERDSAGNCTRGPAELLDCRGVMVDSDGPRVSVVGLNDVVVVVDGDEVLVTSGAGAASVGKLKGASGG